MEMQGHTTLGRSRRGAKSPTSLMKRAERAGNKLTAVANSAKDRTSHASTWKEEEVVHQRFWGKGIEGGEN